MLLVHLERPTPRARYIIGHLLGRMPGWELTFVTREDLRSAGGARLIYGTEALEGAFHLPITVPLEDDLRSALPDGADHPPADPVAAAFHLLALTDEYAPPRTDGHGRIPPEELTITRKGLTGRPVVDQWALALAARIRERFPELPPPARSFRHVLTVDVDNGLKYAGRPFHRALGASARELLRGDATALSARWRTRSGAMSDPYAAFADRLHSLAPKADRTIAFFLMKGNTAHDHAARIGHPAYARALAAVAQRAEIGLHPSYASSDAAGTIASERDQLALATGQRITLSRQHFLRWRLPHTLRELIAAGIKEDHTLGFRDRAGFRAGTCTPFPWYDLEREEETPLMLWPFACMDSAMEEMHPAPADLVAAEHRIRSYRTLIDEVRRVQGTFVSVWHDRHLSGDDRYAPWPGIAEQVLAIARS